MNTRCFDQDEIADVLDLEPGDPRRRHLEECPRCQALAMVFTEFMRDRSVPPGSDLEDANAQLLTAFEKEQGKEQSVGLAPEGMPASRGVVQHRTPWAQILPWLHAAGRRPVLAAAVVVLVAGTVYVSIERHSGSERPDVLRGAPPAPSTAAATSARLLPVEMDPAGNRVLRWRRVLGADAYQVRFFGADLSDFARIGPLADTLLVLSPGVLPAGSVAGATAGWQVVALQGGCELGVSPPGTVQLR
jgi:hypothetical protein